MLNSDTPLGIGYIKNQHKVAELIERKYGVEMIDCGKTAVVDYMACRDKKTVALIEVRCRNITRKALSHKYNDEIIVTHRKISETVELSRIQSVPSFIAFKLLDRTLLIQIADARGEMVVPYRVDRTVTPNNCNKTGIAERDNGFIDVTNAKELHFDSDV